MKRKKNEVTFKELFAWVWLSVFFLITLFNHGIFEGMGLNNPSQYIFEKPLFSIFILTVFVTIWTMIHMLRKQWSWDRRILLGIAALVVPVTYIISSIQPASVYLSKYGILVNVMLFLFFITGMVCSNYERIIRWFPTLYLIFGYLVVIYGFMSLFGNVYMLDTLTAQDGVRITSIFQYTNAYAVLLLTMWIGVLIEINRTAIRSVQIIHGLMLVPICVSFLLTLSRGAFIILPIVAVAALMLFRLKEQVMVILYSMIGMGLSLLIYSKLTERGIEVLSEIQKAVAAKAAFKTVPLFSGDSIIYWAILVGVSIVMAAFIYLIQIYIEPVLRKRTNRYNTIWANLTIPFSLVAIFILGAITFMTSAVSQFLPPIIRGRLENISWQTQSVYERLTMYRDAISVWKEHPWFGGGAGAWQALYERNQSYPYISGQTHSFVIQLLVETGLVGLISITVLFIVVISVFIRYYWKASEEEKANYAFYFITLIAILLHSMIDFEMSFAFFEIIVFLCLGVMASTQRQQFQIKLKEPKKRQIQLAVVAAMGLATIVLVVMASTRIYAVNQLERSSKAAVQNQPLLQVNQIIINGLKKDHGHPVLLQQIIAINYQAYEQTKEQKYLDIAQQYLLEMLRAEPNYRPAVQINYLITSNKGDKSSAIRVMEEAIEKYPFEQNFYEQVMIDRLSDFSDALQANKVSEMKNVGIQIMDLYHKMVVQEKKVADLPDTISLIRTFTISNKARLAAGEVTFFQGDYMQAMNILKLGISEDLSLEENRFVARFYLAALRKQGLDDEDLYQRMIQSDSKEEDEINTLVNAEM